MILPPWKKVCGRPFKPKSTKKGGLHAYQTSTKVDQDGYKNQIRPRPGSISPNFVRQSQKLTLHSICQEIRHSISPTIKTPNFKLKLAHFLPNLFAVHQTLCAKKSLSSCVRKKLRTYVDEIDPLYERLLCIHFYFF